MAKAFRQAKAIASPLAPAELGHVVAKADLRHGVKSQGSELQGMCRGCAHSENLKSRHISAAKALSTSSFCSIFHTLAASGPTFSELHSARPKAVT